MIEPRRHDRIGIAVLILILIVAAALRLHNLSYGLPSLFDPDEPLFILKSFEVLTQGSLNPHWFGHPGSTTIYSVAIVEAMVLAFGLLTGEYASVEAFAAAAYLNPSPLLLAARVFIVLCALACVLLTYFVGRNLFDRRTGLLAAALLAINPLHIELSQVVRTDVHATVFMLIAILFSIALYRTGRTRHYVLAGVFVGVASATKWPAAITVVAPLLAAWLGTRDLPDRALSLTKGGGIIAASAAVGLIAASPFILLDYDTVIANLTNETRPSHPGATGAGFLSNVIWYIVGPMRDSIGSLGLVMTLAGMIAVVRRSKLATVTVLALTILFIIMISKQSLIWARWIVPILPFVSLFMAVTIVQLSDWAKQRGFGRWAASGLTALVALLLVVPMLVTDRAQAFERSNDTRRLAAAWAKSHVPSGSSFLFEYFAYDFISQPWNLRFPAGHLGCIDPVRTLRGEMSFDETESWRRGKSVVDVGSVDPERLDSCRTDFAMLTNYERYRIAPDRFPGQVRNYHALLDGGRVLKVFRPKSGEIGGPVIWMVQLRQQPGKPIGSTHSAR